MIDEPPTELRKRTKQFALRIVRMCEELPSDRKGRILGDQVFRSGTSVGANYREAFRARSRAEFIAKLGDAQRELEETIYWLELLVESGVFPTAKLQPLHHEADELMAIFAASLKTARSSRS